MLSVARMVGLLQGYFLEKGHAGIIRLYIRMSITIQSDGWVVKEQVGVSQYDRRYIRVRGSRQGSPFFFFFNKKINKKINKGYYLSR